MRTRVIVEVTCPDCGTRRSRRADAKGTERCVACAMKRVAKTRKPRAKAIVACPCGLSFHPGHLRMEYCSRSCASKYGPARRLGKKYPNEATAPIKTCPTCGKEFRAIKETANRPMVYCSHDCYMHSREETTIEAAIRRVLESSGVEHIPQHRIGQWTVDFYIPKTKTVLEADGDYWHALPKVAEKDGRKDAWMAAHGYEIIHLPEIEIRTNPEDVIRRRWTRWAKEHGQAIGTGGLE